MLEGAWEDEAIARAEHRPARRYYRLTPLGEGAMSEVLERFPALVRLFGTEAEPA